MTGLILFISGFVIGYLFTYREQVQEASEQIDLDDEIERLRDTIDSERIYSFELKQENDKLIGNLHLLQQLCDDLESEREKSPRSSADVQPKFSVSVVELHTLQQKLASSAFI